MIGAFILFLFESNLLRAGSLYNPHLQRRLDFQLWLEKAWKQLICWKNPDVPLAQYNCRSCQLGWYRITESWIMGMYMDGKYMSHLPHFPTPGPMIDITNQSHHSFPMSLVAALDLLLNCPWEWSSWYMRGPTPATRVGKEYGLGRESDLNLLTQILKCTCWVVFS